MHQLPTGDSSSDPSSYSSHGDPCEKDHSSGFYVKGYLPGVSSWMPESSSECMGIFSGLLPCPMQQHMSENRLSKKAVSAHDSRLQYLRHSRSTSLILLLYAFLLPSLFSQPVVATEAGETGLISSLVTARGLDFIKDSVVEQAVDILVPLHIHNMEKSLGIPFIGKVYAKLSNITLCRIELSSSTIQPGPSGVTIVASNATAKVTMDWFYSYTSWLFPFGFSDSGMASIQVNGLEIGMTASLENHGGTLRLEALEAGCAMDNISIVLEGGASWLYQGLLDAFEEQIRASVEEAIKKKIVDGTSKIDLLLEKLPKSVNIDEAVSLNVTVVDQPVLKSSSIEVAINGLFFQSRVQPAGSGRLTRKVADYVLCEKFSPMLGISLQEEVFSSASRSYFEGGEMHWTVDNEPNQALMNTAGWRFIIPQLYRKYPNEAMKLNITLTAPPFIKISGVGFDAKVLADMTVVVLDVGGDVSVACISALVLASGVPEISGNNLGGKIAMDDFSLSLKWSKIGNFHMSLIQGVVRVFLNNVVVPYVNSRLRSGFPLPIIHGFTLQHASIQSWDSRIDICTDFMFSPPPHSHMIYSI
ncbi:lipid-binding serum glycoprotein family protein isoform X2 [Wolffia australiana]